MSDAINPDHYKRLPAEAIDIIEAMIAGAPDNKAAYLHGQAAKYDLRLWGKGKSLEDYLTDWQKHIWYALRLESHLLELIEKQKADEQQKASDLQSLKDHPFGKLRQPAWTPKIGDWVRIKKPADTQSSACIWVGSMNRYDGQIIEVKQLSEEGILHDNWGFMFDWLEPAEQPAIKQSSTTEPPDGWRWLEVGEVIRKGDRYFDGDKWKDRDWAIKETYSLMHQKTIRRNRFEVGEKVVHIPSKDILQVIAVAAYVSVVDVRGSVSHYPPEVLAPYIEDAK